MTLDELLAQQQAEEAASQPPALSLDDLLAQQQAEKSQTAEQVGTDYERMFKKGAGQNVATFGASAGAEVARLGDNLMDMVGAMTRRRCSGRYAK